MTVGVEEEFLLVDPVTRRTAPRAEAVLKLTGPLPRGAKTHPELFSTQVEFASGVCESGTELREQLAEGRRVLALAAAREGLALVSSGTAILTDPDIPVADGERFGRIASRYGPLLGDYQVCGCHVHVGVADRDTAIAVINHLSVWLPVLLALSASSPYSHGRDTGYASWRVMQQARLPGSGLTPWFADAAEYDEAAARLVELGILVDGAMTFWLARPSPNFPTVEVRVADALATVDEAVQQAALVEALVRYALAELAAGREARPIPPQWAAAALWTAARHGLAGPAVDLRTGRAAKVFDLVNDLIALVAPGFAVRLPVPLSRDPEAAVDQLIDSTTPEEK
ncbi:MAG: YbdK family carboxylate-amine ligase [Kibdelosporangium sp.]